MRKSGIYVTIYIYFIKQKFENTVKIKVTKKSLLNFKYSDIFFNDLKLIA